MEKEGVSKAKGESARGVGEKVGAAQGCHGSIGVVVATFCLAFIRLSESEQREKKRTKKEIDKGGNERESSYFRRPLSFSLRSRARARAAVPSFLGESRIIRGH